MQHAAQLPLCQSKNIRQRKPLRLRRPRIEYPRDEVGQFFHAERKQRLVRLFLHLDGAGGHLLKQAGKLLCTAGRDCIQIGQAEHLDLQLAGLCIMEAKLLRGIGQQRFARGRREGSFRAREVQQLHLPLTAGLQHPAQAVQLAFLIAVGQQVF